MGIWYEQASRLSLYSADAPGSVTQQHDVAGVALHREIFVKGADHNAIWLGDHGEERSLRNSAAAGNGRQPAASPRPQLAVHFVVMDVCAVAPPSRCNPLGKHCEDRVVSFARKIAIGIGARDQRE